jgi:hypothetical protein
MNEGWDGSMFVPLLPYCLQSARIHHRETQPENPLRYLHTQYLLLLPFLNSPFSSPFPFLFPSFPLPRLSLPISFLSSPPFLSFLLFFFSLPFLSFLRPLQSNPLLFLFLLTPFFSSLSSNVHTPLHLSPSPAFREISYGEISCPPYFPLSCTKL